MGSLQSRLSRLEAVARKSRTALVNDEEVIHALERHDWDGRHLDAMFRVVEPGMLGYTLIGSANLRRVLLAGEDWGEPAAGFHQMYVLVALGSDIRHPVRSEVEYARRWLTKPLQHGEKERTSDNGMMSIHDAQEGLVRRLIQKHRLGHLQTAVGYLADANEHQRFEFFKRFIPRIDQTRWQRMVEMVRPLETYWGHIELLACSSDGMSMWSQDGDGQMRTVELFRHEEDGIEGHKWT